MQNISSLQMEDPLRYGFAKVREKLRLPRDRSLICRVAKQSGSRLLHSHFGNVGWENLSAARHASLQHVVTFYGYDLGFLPKNNQAWQSRYRNLFAEVDLILCEGPHMAKGVVALGCPKEKVSVHHLGIELSRFPFKPRELAIGEPLRVLIAATFREKKGVPFALEALGKLQKDVLLEITLIGDATRQPRDQEERRAIDEIVERYDLEPILRRLGFVTHEKMIEEAYKHHVFLSPSVTASDGDTEGGTPVGIIEMAATGMPIVSTTHCDIPEVIKENQTGLLAPERDSKALVDLLKQLASDPSRWLPMVTAGRAHVEAEYDAAKQGERLASLYWALLA